jgi:hypothetical protein
MMIEVFKINTTNHSIAYDYLIYNIKIKKCPDHSGHFF